MNSSHSKNQNLIRFHQMSRRPNAAAPGCFISRAINAVLAAVSGFGVAAALFYLAVIR